jgi:hypothetical protein
MSGLPASVEGQLLIGKRKRMHLSFQSVHCLSLPCQVVTNAGKTESRTAVIDDHDMLWQELRNLHIAEVTPPLLFQDDQRGTLVERDRCYSSACPQCVQVDAGGKRPLHLVTSPFHCSPWMSDPTLCSGLASFSCRRTFASTTKCSSSTR